MNTDNLRVKWVEVEASVWEAQQAELKALREENERLNLALMRANNVKIENSEASLMYRIAALESQLAELRQGEEAVAYLHKSPDGSRQFLSRNPAQPVATHDDIDTSDWTVTPLFTRPQPAIPPGYAVVRQEIIDRFPELNMANYSYDDVDDLNNWGIELVLSIASAPAIQPQAAAPSVPVAEKDGCGDSEVISMQEVDSFLMKELHEIALWTEPTVDAVIRAQKALHKAKEMLATPADSEGVNTAPVKGEGK